MPPIFLKTIYHYIKPQETAVFLFGYFNPLCVFFCFTIPLFIVTLTVIFKV